MTYNTIVFAQIPGGYYYYFFLSRKSQINFNYNTKSGKRGVVINQLHIMRDHVYEDLQKKLE